VADEKEFFEVMNNRFEKTREKYILKKKTSTGESEQFGNNFMDYFAGNSELKRILV